MQSPIFTEAKRLHAMGFGVLWIKPKSKAPVKSKWTTGPRESWDQLKQSYKPGFNVGVRLGTPSSVNGKYLAVIDIDVKSTEKVHQAEAEKRVRELFPEIKADAIQVMSGRGNGSSHIYILTDKPAVPSKRAVSKDKVKVLMPSVSPSQSSKEALSAEDINEGYRIRPAWEIAVMGEGQQVVLPYSIHPDSGKAYKWKHELKDPKQLAVIETGHADKIKERTSVADWTPEPFDLVTSDLPDDVVDTILNANVEDRSASLFTVGIAMAQHGLSDRVIMSVLTDQEYELGKVAYEHAKTNSRNRAANWIYNYTLKKVRKETDATAQFEAEVETVELSDEEAKKQALELQALDWRTLIERHGPTGMNANAPRSTLKNILLILTNEVASDVFKRDQFSIRDFYGYNTPWGGVKGALLTDDDAIKIKVWLGARYRFEPNKDLIYDAMSFLSEKNAFNPVHDWLAALPEWDGVNRLDTWLSNYFEAEGDKEYLGQVFRKWIVAMVMRAYEPGAKFDWMPIFEGKQGIGKSSIGRLLVGEKYFLDWLPDLSDKDAALSLQGAWAVEFGELANIRKQDVESAKAFITRTVDKVRPPYGRRWLESPRRCVFFGTTNSDTYLRDDSGNRRFKPVKVGQLDFNALIRDREQLFAEALFIYKNGFETEITLDIEGAAKLYEQQIQADKMVEDESAFLVEKLREFVGNETKKSEPFNFKKFRLVDLFDDEFGPFKGGRSDMRQLQMGAKAVKHLGGEKYKSHGTLYWRFKTDARGIPTWYTYTPGKIPKSTLDFNDLQ